MDLFSVSASEQDIIFTLRSAKWHCKYVVHVSIRVNKPIIGFHSVYTINLAWHQHNTHVFFTTRPFLKGWILFFSLLARIVELWLYKSTAKHIESATGL